MNSLTAFWWYPREGKNLGDELTTELLTRAFSVDHEHARMERANLLSTGSLLNWVWDREPVKNRKEKLSVVGSGFMHPYLVAQRLDFLKLYSVRGYLSKSVLYQNAHSKITVGDPGLLSSLLARLTRPDRTTYGIIPHYTRVEDRQLLDRFEMLPNSKVIDFRTGDLPATIAEMESCDVILSQSLHGLIISDSLRIPNVWVNDGPLHTGGAFKFYDYFSSVGRPFDTFLNKNDTITEKAVLSNLFELPLAKLRQRQSDIVGAFVQFFQDNGIVYRSPVDEY